MASAARSITRLVEHRLVERRDGGVAITPMGALMRISQALARMQGGASLASA